MKRMKKINLKCKEVFLSLVILGIILTGFSLVAAIEPNGASVNEVRSETAGTGTPESHNATAGNVTELTITGYSTTQSWQGYFGNVSGTIQLADADGDVMYNWSKTTAEGEVFAVNESSVDWSNIKCFNFTADGSTELNLTTLESLFNINSSDVDGVDETFNLNNHPQFDVGGTSFTTGECKNTKIYNSSGVGVFNEVLLYDDTNNLVVFTSLLSDDTTGYDGKSHDFEMLVLEDGHSGDTSVTTYYFYIELNA